MPDDLLDLAEHLRQAVGNFVRAARAQSNTPTTARSETLGLLDRGNAMNIADLAEARRVKHQSMRLVIEQLERDGLVKKTANPQDRRSQLIVLTREGNAALEKDRRLRSEWIAQMLRQHASTEERHAVGIAIGVLQRISAAVDTKQDM